MHIIRMNGNTAYAFSLYKGFLVFFSIFENIWKHMFDFVTDKIVYQYISTVF